LSRENGLLAESLKIYRVHLSKENGLKMKIWKTLKTTGLFGISVSIVGYVAYFYFTFNQDTRNYVPTKAQHSVHELSTSKIAEEIEISDELHLFSSIRPEEGRIVIDIENKALFFDTASYGVRNDLLPVFRDIVKRLGDYSHLLISGHADGVGDWDYNYQLSKRRASAVAEMFVRAGVNPAYITSQGFGESEPAASNSTEDGRIRNRRVMIDALYGPPIVEPNFIYVDSCETPGNWKESLACSLKNNMWFLLVAFLSAVATLIGLVGQVIRALLFREQGTLPDRPGTSSG
jgi:outer membrane protein OmpA-like peptidoglycan-associated protein